MSDLLVGMIFIFIILMTIFAMSYRDAEERLNKKIDNLEEELSSRNRYRANLLSGLQRTLGNSNIDVEIDEKNGLLHLPEDVLFESGSATLNPQGVMVLRRLAEVLALRLPCFSEPRRRAELRCDDETSPILEAVYIEGHTDNRNISTAQFPSNWELSSARAIATFRAMTDAAEGQGLKQIKNASGKVALLGVSAYADQRPKDEHANDTEEGRRDNRRIDIRFLISPPTREELEGEGENVSGFLSSL